MQMNTRLYLISRDKFFLYFFLIFSIHFSINRTPTLIRLGSYSDVQIEKCGFFPIETWTQPMCVYSIELILIHTSLHHRRLYHSAWITATLSSVVNPTSAGWLSRILLVGRGVDISTVLCSPATACHTSSLTYIKLNVAVAICRGVPQGVRKTASLWRNPILQHNTPCISTQKPFNL